MLKMMTTKMTRKMMVCKWRHRILTWSATWPIKSLSTTVLPVIRRLTSNSLFWDSDTTVMNVHLLHVSNVTLKTNNAVQICWMIKIEYLKLKCFIAHSKIKWKIFGTTRHVKTNLNWTELKELKLLVICMVVSYYFVFQEWFCSRLPIPR